MVQRNGLNGIISLAVLCARKVKKYGLVVDLCHKCHNEPPDGLHHNKDVMLKLHQYGQKKVMQEQGWTIERFRQEFRKNYLNTGE